MYRGRKSRRLRAPARSSRTAISQIHPNPPQIVSNVQVSHKYRFVSTSATSTAITPTSLLGAMGTLGTAALTNTAYFGSVKVASIEMWAPPASQGASTTISVNFIGTANSPNREYSDTTVSVATPAHLKCTPPAMSLASFWQVPSATALFTLIAPVGTIIDVMLTGILNDQDENPVNITVVTTAAGFSYYLSLDPVATHRYTPVSLATTF